MNWLELKHRVTGGGQKEVAPALMLLAGPKGSRRFALNRSLAQQMQISESPCRLRIFLSEDKRWLGIAVDKAGSYIAKPTKYGSVGLPFLTKLLAIEGLCPVQPPTAIAAKVPEDTDRNPVFAFDLTNLTEVKACE